MSDNLLSNINSPIDLRLLNEAQLPLLAQELRDFIINVVAVKKGHLGASLGVVELTIALHYVFDTPNDLLGVSYIKTISASTDFKVVMQLVGLGLILTIISSCASVGFILRYEPLKILSNRN